MRDLDDHEEMLVMTLKKPRILPADLAALVAISAWAGRECDKLSKRGSSSERLRRIAAAFTIEGGFNAGMLPDDLTARVTGRVLVRE